MDATRFTGIGRRRTPEFSAWLGIRQRCFSPNYRQFKDYGGRGIGVCVRWDSFENFLADMGKRPSKDYSIDRIDNDGPYSPENCRWATRAQQQANRRVRASTGVVGIAHDPKRNSFKWEVRRNGRIRAGRNSTLHAAQIALTEATRILEETNA